MSDPVLSNIPSANELRAELEAMVLGDLLGPAGGANEEMFEPPRGQEDRKAECEQAPGTCSL